MSPAPCGGPDLKCSRMGCSPLATRPCWWWRTTATRANPWASSCCWISGCMRRLLTRADPWSCTGSDEAEQEHEGVGVVAELLVGHLGLRVVGHCDGARRHCREQAVGIQLVREGIEPQLVGV